MVKVMRRVDMLHPWILARCREVEQPQTGYFGLVESRALQVLDHHTGGAVQEILKDPEITIGILSIPSPL